MKKLLFIFLILAFIFQTSFAFNVYFKNKTVKIGVPNELIINASDYKGKVRGVINFGNFIVKWDCVYLNHEVINYTIIPTTTEGTVFFEFEDGKIYSKTFKIEDNPNYKLNPNIMTLTYVQEKNCVFKSPNENKNESSTIIIEKENNYLIIIAVLITLLIAVFIFLYFYFFNRNEEETIRKIEEKITISPLKRKLLQIEKENDYKKKAFLLYKLVSEENYLKKKINESDVHKLYLISFKKEITEEDKAFIDNLINQLR